MSGVLCVMDDNWTGVTSCIDLRVEDELVDRMEVWKYGFTGLLHPSWHKWGDHDRDTEVGDKIKYTFAHFMARSV